MCAFLLISSDIHSGSLDFERIAAKASDKNCLSLLFCGDIDLESWENGEILRNRNFSFLPVLGNCDSPWSFRDINMQAPPLFRKAEFFGLRIFITHGHYGSYPSDFGLENSDFDLIVNGHTHIPVLEKQNGFIFLNPGSVSLPRGYSEKSYAILEFLENSVLIRIKRLSNDGVISELSIPLNK